MSTPSRRIAYAERQVQRVLAGMRESLTDDEPLRLAAAAVFEGLHVAFAQEDAS